MNKEKIKTEIQELKRQRKYWLFCYDWGYSNETLIELIKVEKVLESKELRLYQILKRQLR